MSQIGQPRRFAPSADCFRSSSNNGHFREQSVRLKRATSGLTRRNKELSSLSSTVSMVAIYFGYVWILERLGFKI